MSEDKVEKVTRFNPRKALFLFGSLFVIITMFLVDHDGGLIKDLPFGSSTVTYLVYMSTGIVGVGILYICERALFYAINYLQVVKKAMEHPIGAGLVAVAIPLQMVAVAIVLSAIWN